MLFIVIACHIQPTFGGPTSGFLCVIACKSGYAACLIGGVSATIGTAGAAAPSLVGCHILFGVCLATCGVATVVPIIP